MNLHTDTMEDDIILTTVSTVDENADRDNFSNVKPLFLTKKFQIHTLPSNVYDFQLRDHFLNTSDLNVLQCNCINHKHNKRPCKITTEKYCLKCKKPTKLLITYQSMLFHEDIYTKIVSTCCKHIHKPPCNRCLNCQTNVKCIVPYEFECNISTDVVCHLDLRIFTTKLPYEDIMIHEHVYNIKSPAPTFYFCRQHTHKHKSNSTVDCIIQNMKCCNSATIIEDFNECFTVCIAKQNIPIKKPKKNKTKINLQKNTSNKRKNSKKLLASNEKLNTTTIQTSATELSNLAITQPTLLPPTLTTQEFRNLNFNNLENISQCNSSYNRRTSQTSTELILLKNSPSNSIITNTENVGAEKFHNDNKRKSNLNNALINHIDDDDDDDNDIQQQKHQERQQKYQNIHSQESIQQQINENSQLTIKNTQNDDANSTNNNHNNTAIAASSSINSNINNNEQQCKISAATETTDLDRINKRKYFNEFIIYNPAIWHEQSMNHFMSFIRAVISNPSVALERYKRFETSKFSIPNIKKYKSGKESFARTAVTGFETIGIYQTTIISCTIPYYMVILPQKLYDLLELEHFDLDLVLLVRHPSILPTCLYVCAAKRNIDPTIDVITISDQQSKGLNQDQDGDKNPIYFLRKRINNCDATQSYRYKLAKTEMANAFRNKITLMSHPRYIFSETTLLLLDRYKEKFKQNNKFCRHTSEYGFKFMNEAICGYYKNEYDEFQQLLMHHNQTDHEGPVTLDDLLLVRSTRLPSIISSGAKKSKELLEMFLTNISTTRTLHDMKVQMMDMCNQYIKSSQDLSLNGRKQFTAMYAAQDLISLHDCIYLNKIFYASYKNFASVGVLLLNISSLELFCDELLTLDENNK